MTGKDIRIIYMGTPDFAVAPLKALVERGYNVVAVVTTPDKPAGRGLKVNESAVKKYALSANLPVFQPVKLKDPDFLRELQSYNADLFIVVAFRMLPEAVWGMPPLGTFNLHASLLPQYRGAAPINWALINGEKESGVTTFFLNSRMDEGAIIDQKKVLVLPKDNAGTLHDKLMAAGTELVADTVNRIASGNTETQPQDSCDPANLKPAPKIFKDTCRVDFSTSGDKIVNLIRGLSPYPAAWSEMVSDLENNPPLQLKIFSAEFIPDRHCAKPGMIESDGRSYIDVVCADGRVRLGDIQPAGKRRMTVGEFLNGFRDITDYSFS